MKCLSWRLGALAALFCSVTAVPARAQSSIDRWTGLNVGGLQTVYVKDTSGVESAGPLLRINPDSLVLLVDGAERQLPLGDVARIQKRDSLRNGTLIGLAIGTVMGIVSGGLSDCPGNNPGGSCAHFRAVMLVLSAGVYTGLGTGVDALIRGRTTLYEQREPRSRRSSVATMSVP
jgi:hypothetical protein